jgi:hypothetical protein
VTEAEKLESNAEGLGNPSHASEGRIQVGLPRRYGWGTCRSALSAIISHGVGPLDSDGTVSPVGVPGGRQSDAVTRPTLSLSDPGPTGPDGTDGGPGTVYSLTR